jgi:hypothetical protein
MGGFPNGVKTTKIARTISIIPDISSKKGCGAAAGISLWASGGSRKSKAELNLQKFNLAPKGSMAVGLGITITF